jgi:hypothetical protein
MSTAPERPHLCERCDRLGVWFCDNLAADQSVRGVAEELNASATGILKWFDREYDRTGQYQFARQAQADALVDGLIDLVDEPVPVGPDAGSIQAVNDKRLRIDTRKWIASKFRPIMYGDRVQVEDVSPPGREQKPEEVMARITITLAAHGLRIVPDDQQSAGLGDAI